MSRLEELQRKFKGVWAQLDERSRRMMAASEAIELGYGGVSQVQRASGLSRKAIAKGIREIRSGERISDGRVRRPGSGRKKITVSDPELLAILEPIVESGTRGDPESPLRWLCKSTRSVAAELTRKKHPISYVTVARLLRSQNFSLQGNRKREAGGDRPDRESQFGHISTCVMKAFAAGIPVISVDTQMKELGRRRDTAARQSLPTGHPRKVGVHDFPAKEIPSAASYKSGDWARHSGFVTVAADPDTGPFAAASICGWWRAEGRQLYPEADQIVITARGGGSTGCKLRRWKEGLQRLADETGLSILVCHFPPGASKWNKMEHRLLSFVSSTWQGEPLRAFETVINLIADATTAKGTGAICRLDRQKDATERIVSADEMSQVKPKCNLFNGDWIYTIHPNSIG